MTTTNKMRMVCFLQNAWSPVYAGGHWPRRSWLRALERSRSGQRLRWFVDFDDCENTTPQVAKDPDGVIPPDYWHIEEILKRRKPDVVVAFGKQAERALMEIWRGPLLALPHPACRVVTTRAYLKGNALLVSGYNQRVAIRQKRGRVELEAL